MLFNSVDYIVFLALVFLAFWGLEPSTSPFARALGKVPARRRALAITRVVLLLVASYLFYMSWNAVFILLIVGSTLVDYLVGLGLGALDDSRARSRKALVAVSLVANLGLLGLFKYFDFASLATAQTLDVLGIAWEAPQLRLILPVGISFYTFQTLSYTIDVYRRRLEPTRSLLEFATYVAFFPQLVAGPIVRAREFLPQFRRPAQLSIAGARSGIYLILRGLVKKVAIADFLAVNLIDRVFEDPGAFSSGEVWVAVYGYTWQLYGDFSGYTDIARGSARLLGFELPENFDRPFNTTGPIEFWRRWHITLSTWVQDYIYIPLGGSQRGTLRTYANLFLSFLIIGVWHGAGWTFVLFGLWHAVGVTVNRAYRQLTGSKKRPRGLLRALMVFVSVHFFVVHWPIFRASSLENMLDVYQQMLANDWASLRVGVGVWAVIFGMALTHFCPKSWLDAVEGRLRNLPWPLMGLVVVAVAAALMKLSAEQAAPFIYFRF